MTFTTNELYVPPGRARDKCEDCHHFWHGLPCAVVLNYYETGDARTNCNCPGPFAKKENNEQAE